MFKVKIKTLKRCGSCVFYCYLWLCVTLFSSASITDFDRVNVCWDVISTINDKNAPDYQLSSTILFRIKDTCGSKSK